MITARRSNGITGQTETSARGGIDVLERKTGVTNERVDLTEERGTERTEAETRELMQRNLERLMNYDRFSENQAAEKAAVKTEEPVKETPAPIKAAVSTDDDIRPTSTTMQFGDGDTSKVYNDLERSKENQSYKLNGKGKLVVALYALVVAVILALITVNTGVLKSLDNDIAALNTAYATNLQSVAMQNAEIESISSEAHIIEIAENDYGMIIK